MTRLEELTNKYMALTGPDSNPDYAEQQELIELQYSRILELEAKGARIEPVVHAAGEAEQS